jgi:hypothetical protein
VYDLYKQYKGFIQEKLFLSHTVTFFGIGPSLKRVLADYLKKEAGLNFDKGWRKGKLGMIRTFL